MDADLDLLLTAVYVTADDLLVDSTPVERARSRETVKRSALGDEADYGYRRSHSRYSWAFACTRSSPPTAPPGAHAGLARAR
jgi:hypothetical protein